MKNVEAGTASFVHICTIMKRSETPTLPARSSKVGPTNTTSFNQAMPTKPSSNNKTTPAPPPIPSSSDDQDEIPLQDKPKKGTHKNSKLPTGSSSRPKPQRIASVELLVGISKQNLSSQPTEAKKRKAVDAKEKETKKKKKEVQDDGNVAENEEEKAAKPKKRRKTSKHSATPTRVMVLPYHSHGAYEFKVNVLRFYLY